MEWEEFIGIVNEIKNKKPVWFGLDSDPPCTDSDITKIVNSLSVQFPTEYKMFLKGIGGGYFAFTNLFSGTKDSEWNILTQNNEAGLLETKNFLAISDNGVGDFYGFKVKNGLCEAKISFFDHEDNQIKPTKYENLYEYLIKVGLSPR